MGPVHLFPLIMSYIIESYLLRQFKIIDNHHKESLIKTVKTIKQLTKCFV